MSENVFYKNGKWEAIKNLEILDCGVKLQHKLVGFLIYISR